MHCCGLCVHWCLLCWVNAMCVGHSMQRAGDMCYSNAAVCVSALHVQQSCIAAHSDVMHCAVSGHGGFMHGWLRASCRLRCATDYVVCELQLLPSCTPTLSTFHHHHHQITKLSHSINAIGPAPHRGGRNREHRSIVFATITHIPSLHKIRRNAPRYHPTNPLEYLCHLPTVPSSNVNSV
jgi:hypothetical protein